MLAYHDAEAAGWCSVGPREDYAALESSRMLERVAAQPVWSVVCFFVAKAYRNHGALRALLRGTVGYAAS